MYAPTPEQSYPTPLAGAMCQAASLMLLQKADEEAEAPLQSLTAQQRASITWRTVVQVFS